MKNPKLFSNNLAEAVHLIEQAAALLDESSEPCGTCGLRKYAEHDEHLMAEQLRGAIGRCERARAAVAGKDGAP